MTTVKSTSMNKSSPTRLFRHVWDEYNIIVVTVVIFIVAGLIAPRFLTTMNILLVLRHSAVIGIIAMGMTFVIITGGIDLSSGHVLAMSGTILLMLQGNENVPLWVAILGCFAVATVMGFVNGVIITKIRLPAFIVTLAVGIIARSLTLFVTDGRTVDGRRTPEFTAIGNGSLGIIPYSLIVWVLLAVILGCILAYTKYGSYTYAVGGSEITARHSGISVDTIKIAAYTLTGFCVGVASLFNFSRVAAILPGTAGNMFEFDAITAVVVGGCALSGGRGKILGTFFGMIIIGVVSNLLIMFQISPFLTGTVKGTLILLAVLLQRRDKAL
jgi:ribose transport system permease protein